MPQELALFGENTIEDTFIYFGRLNHLRRSEIDEKIEFLLKFLHLPSKTKLISQLSGGQQRRVSLSVALLHSPKLLILDEPTVGADPLLRQQIWIYLQRLCREEGMTVSIECFQ
jgi:ABC-type multidrug transport system ATPase subunit